MRALPVFALGFMLATVIYSRYTLNGLTRTQLSGPEMDVHKQRGKHWFKHVIRPSQVGGAYYIMQEFVSKDEKDGFYDGKPGSPPSHIHPHQSEEFTVVQGEFAFLLNGTTHVLKAGETATIPPGWEHYFWNHNPEQDLLFNVKLTPGLKSDLFFANLAGILRDSEKDFREGSRSASPLQILAVMYEYEVIVADIPALIREPFLKVMHTAAPWFGYKFAYEEYDSPIPDFLLLEAPDAARGVSEEPAVVGGGDENAHDEM